MESKESILLTILFNHPMSYLMQASLVAVVLWFFVFSKNKSNRKTNQNESADSKSSKNLSKAKTFRSKASIQDQEKRISRWQPEPLTSPLNDSNHFALNLRKVSSFYGKSITINEKKCLNLATHNYLGLAEDEQCIDDAILAVRKYGVGSCGPRGFFGTVDIHLKLEEEIARFMRTEEAILYSYGYAAISSAIPAYSSKKDVIFVDENVSFPIQQGLIASRSNIKYFKHNDMEDLKRLLEEQRRLDLENPKLAKITSRFLVVEGLYINSGDLCPLKEIIELKKEHKVRLFIEDTCAFGVLGENGRGTVEHFGCEIEDIDMIAVSLEFACASYGGFCAGSSFVIDHQRLSGLGYCFSASLPPLQAAYAYRALKQIEKKPELLKSLKENCTLMHNLLSERSDLISVDSSSISPVKHIRFAEKIDEARLEKFSISREKFSKLKLYQLDVERLENVVELAFEEGYALTLARYLIQHEHKLPEPSIRLTVSASLTSIEIELFVQKLIEAFQQAQKNFYQNKLQ
ncbi:Nidogen-2 [Sarcoptes scabiei]|nr:Nidogen-2 [Sarcoptes scabiei]